MQAGIDEDKRRSGHSETTKHYSLAILKNGQNISDSASLIDHRMVSARNVSFVHAREK